MDARVRRLESLRQEIECYSRSAGNLGDYLDHGNPSAAQADRASRQMQEDSDKAESLRVRLAGELAELRRAAPEVVAAWAGWHLAQCREIASESPETRHPWQDDSRDQSVRLYVAAETAKAWERVFRGEESCVLVNAYWLPDYEERAQRWGRS